MPASSFLRTIHKFDSANSVFNCVFFLHRFNPRSACIIIAAVSVRVLISSHRYAANRVVMQTFLKQDKPRTFRCRREYFSYRQWSAPLR
jgi:hypothetical protein